MRPDFTGTWKLIAGESDFHFLAPPRLRVDTIQHEEPRLSVRTRQKDRNGDVTVDRELEIGGPAVEVAIHGRPRRIRAWWTDEAELGVETLFEVSGQLRRIEDRWSLEPAGEWLTIERRIEQPGGDVRQVFRLARRSGPAPGVRP